ncbi:MAG TPA: nucleotidyltransferase domain-containing protein [Armatimonadota bacterium]|nr:nucleotidyltransferase domain-containing protein [Armatimonadota bacterium]
MKPHGIDLDSGAIQMFCEKWKIKRLSVFGSILRDDFGPDSDVDFVAEYEEDADWDLLDCLRAQEELQSIIGRKVDLLERAGIDSSANRFLKKEILSTLETVHAAR